MSPLRTLTLCFSLLPAACTKDGAGDPASAKAAPTKAPAHVVQVQDPPAKAAAPDPHAMVKAREDEGTPLPPLLASAPGAFDMKIGDTLTHFGRLPAGQNRAVAIDGRKIARTSIAAAETEAGWPHMRITLENLRPDRVTYPLVVPSKDHDAITVSARYQVNENRIYTGGLDPAAPFTVTLESYEGPVITGHFEGTLTPTKAGLGDPLTVSGKFEVELGLRNVEPGAPAPDGEAQPPL